MKQRHSRSAKQLLAALLALMLAAGTLPIPAPAAYVPRRNGYLAAHQGDDALWANDQDEEEEKQEETVQQNDQTSAQSAEASVAVQAEESGDVVDGGTVEKLDFSSGFPTSEMVYQANGGGTITVTPSADKVTRVQTEMNGISPMPSPEI